MIVGSGFRISIDSSATGTSARVEPTSVFRPRTRSRRYAGLCPVYMDLSCNGKFLP